MAAENGRTNSDLGFGRALLERPYEFNFFQAVRLLALLYPHRLPLAGDGLPSEEIVRFHTHQSLAFPPSAIHEITAGDNNRPEEKAKVPGMTICFLGLTGRQGVLPFHYTEYLIERRYEKDTTAADFFDIFVHRLTSFFYRAWEKHSVAMQYEQQHSGLPDSPNLTQYVFDLVGLGLPRLRSGAAPLDPQALVFYSGLLGQRPRSAVAFEGLLRDYFQVGVRITQFCGRWFALARSEQTDIRTSGLHNILGEGASLGDAVWSPQATVRLHIGPLTRDQYEAFLPGGPGRAGGRALQLLIAWTDLFFDGSVDFDIQLCLKKKEVPAFYLWDEWDTSIRDIPAEASCEPPALGLTTWLKTSDFEHDAQDVILSSQSARTSFSAEATA